MDELLEQLGFSSKETKIYMMLLENGSRTAAEIARLSSEKRANTYMILDVLMAKGVIEPNDDTAVRTFSAATPTNLKKLLQQELDRQLQIKAALDAALPKLVSTYQLTNDKPGVAHMQGPDGFMTLLRDMTHSTTEVRLIASNKIPIDKQVLLDFRKMLLARKKAGISTRAIFHRDAKSDLQKELFSRRGIELRFLGEEEFDGEVALYESNVAFTVYEPSLVVTVITNSAITKTMGIVFEELWDKAKP